MPKRVKRFGKEEDGAALLEGAIVFVPFILFAMAIFDLALGYFANTVLDHGVESMARQIRTNQITAQTHTAAQFKTELCSMGMLSMFRCDDLHVDVRQVGQFEEQGTPRKADGSLDTDGMGFNPGGRVTINVMTAYYEWPMLMKWNNFTDREVGHNGKKLLSSSKAFRKEP